MADEQTGAFFLPPDDAAAPAFAAAPAAGEESHIGDAYYGTAPGDAFAAPAEGAPADGAVLLGEPAPYAAPAEAYEAPPADGDPFAAPAVEDVADEDAAEGAGVLVAAEPTAMAKWNEGWQETLRARKEEENAVKAAHVEKAREEIAAFQAEREKRRESRMAKNRSDEQDKLEAIEADLENDNSFQRVVKMIELSQDSTGGAADVGRMRDVLVLLKNEPARVDALSA